MVGAADSKLGVTPTYMGTDPDLLKAAIDNAKDKGKELLNQFNVDPITLEDIDRNVASYIQSCITNEVYTRKLFNESDQSGRTMLLSE